MQSAFMSSTGTFGTLAVDQTPDPAAADIVANVNRIALLIQNSGTTTITVAFSATNPQNGVVLAAGTGANDGLGGSIEVTNYTGGIWLYALSGVAGNARYLEVTGA